MLEVELGYNTTGYDQQTQTRGLAVPPPTYGQTSRMTQPAPAGLPPNWGAPSTGDLYSGLSNYDGIALESYTDYPEAISNNAKRGIELNEAVNNRCATQVGKVRATQLAEKKPISVDTIQRMYSYLSRAETYYDENDTKACGTISYLLWGGLAAKRWSESKLKELGLIDELETSVSVGSSYAGQFGDTKKKN